MTTTATPDAPTLLPQDPSIWQDMAEFSADEAAAKGGAFAPPPPRDSYQCRLPDTFQVRPTFDGTALEIGMDTLTIAEGPHAGYVMKYVKVTTKLRTQSSGKPTTGLGMLLLNAGLSGQAVLEIHRLMGDPAAFQAAIEEALAQIAGTVIPVYCDWEGEDKTLGKMDKTRYYRGMGPGKGERRFAQTGADGALLPYVDLDKTEPDPKNPGQERKVRVWARLKPTYSGFDPKRSAA